MKSILLVKTFLGLVEMMSGLVNASFSLPEWQAVKMIFFAPCTITNTNGKDLLLLSARISCIMTPMRNPCVGDECTYDALRSLFSVGKTTQNNI